MTIHATTHSGLAPRPRRRLHAARYDARNGDWDVFLGRSHDGGRSWGDVHRLDDDAVGSGSHQYLPELDVSPEAGPTPSSTTAATTCSGNDVYNTY